MAAVLLLTDRPIFESTWSAACAAVGLSVQARARAEFANALTSGLPAVIDGDSGDWLQAELLGCVGFARAVGAPVAVAFPDQAACSLRDEDVLLELCAGLIARGERDVARVAAALARRCDPKRAARFEYLALAPHGDELLAILGDGSVALVERPLGNEDHGGSVEAIQVAEDQHSARVFLGDGEHVDLVAADFARRASAPATTSSAPAALGDIDGVRLGQRLRALRLAAGLTQAELARRTGIHRPNIARVEAGRHTPSLETLARLAAAIGVSTTRVLAD